MAPSKLTDADKQEIITLYRQPGETTLTLAHRYGVSNTTISRILKSNLPADEYESLIQQKRSDRGGLESPVVQGDLLQVATPAPVPVPDIPPTPAEPSPQVAATVTPEPEVVSSGQRRLRRRSSAPVPATPAVADGQDEIAEITPSLTATELAEPETAVPSAVAEMLGEDLLERSDLDEGDEDEDEDDDDDDLDDLDDDGLEDDDLEDDDDSGMTLPALQVRAVQVLPLAEAPIPTTCYLVVDRAAELVARPLREFGDLGQIPSGEIQEKTLPVFDNHRVARRFSNHRTQRVIKVPDGRVLRKTSSYLQAKGITRLLIDGQVYALSED